MSREVVLKAEHIVKKYGKQVVLADADITLLQGECVGISGRNGCGKTTLLSILAGVEKADGGRFSVAGGKAGYVPQTNPLLEDMTVADNLWLRCKNAQQRNRIMETYELSEIAGKRVSKLSGGMKRRLAIACAMADAPGVLLLDEPTASLDVEYKAIIHREMREYLEQGGTILLVSHEAEELSLCDRVYRMEEGRLQVCESL